MPTFRNRLIRSAAAANELSLPLCGVNTNLHSFVKKVDGAKVLYLSVFSCIFALQKKIFRYYVSSTSNYSEIQHTGHLARHDMAEFCESYLFPLLQNEHMDLILDGCQYRRVDKVKIISDWDIAQKYLNVCWGRTADASNCGYCSKCLRTLLPLEILGKLDKFSRVFNIEQYRQISFQNKIRCLQNYGEEPFETENVDLARENNFPMPTKHECYTLGTQAVIIN